MWNQLKKWGGAALLGLGLMAAEVANAALPTAVGTTVTAIQTNAQDIFDLVFPVIGVILGLTVIIKLFKRFANKA